MDPKPMLLIDGRRLEGEGETITHWYRRTGTQAEYRSASHDQMEATVAAARKVEKLPAAVRAERLIALARLLRRDSKNLAAAVAVETGQAEQLLHWEWNDVASELHSLAEFISEPACFHVGPWGEKCVYVPYDLGLVIGASNTFTNEMWHAAALLAGGSRVIIKPAEYTPTPALLFAEYADMAGFQPGYCQVVPCVGSVRNRLCKQADIIAMTASPAACSSVRSLVNEYHIPVACEGNGISFAFVAADVTDVGAAAQDLYKMCRMFEGELCYRPQVICIERPAFSYFVSVMRVLMEGQYFCCRSPRDRDRILELMAAMEMGAKNKNGANIAVHGGEVKDGEGFYMSPILITADKWSDFFKVEAFANFTIVVEVGSLEDAVHLANTYGTLMVSLWTQDDERAARLTEVLNKPSQVMRNRHQIRLQESGRFPWIYGDWCSRGPEGMRRLMHMQGR